MVVVCKALVNVVSFTAFTALAVAASVVLVEFVALDNWTTPCAVVDAVGKRPVGTVPLVS